MEPGGWSLQCTWRDHVFKLESPRFHILKSTNNKQVYQRYISVQPIHMQYRYCTCSTNQPAEILICTGHFLNLCIYCVKRKWINSTYDWSLNNHKIRGEMYLLFYKGLSIGVMLWPSIYNEPVSFITRQKWCEKVLPN